MFAAVVVCLIDSSFILAWNLTYVNTFFHFFLKTLFFLFLPSADKETSMFPCPLTTQNDGPVF